MKKTKELTTALVPETEQPYPIPKNWVWTKMRLLMAKSTRTINPSRYANEIFESYSVPSFPTGEPEIIQGNKVGSSKQIVEPNDVLLCKINPRINRVWVVGNKRDYRQIASTEWIVLRGDSNTNPNYIGFALQSSHFRDIFAGNVSGVGGSLTRARPKDAALYPVPIAPLSEQNRIADKLASLLGKIKDAKALLDEVPEILQNFRQTVLAAATSGDLTRDWRNDSGRSVKWKEVDIQSISVVGTGSTPLRSNPNFYADQGTPWVTSAATGQPFVNYASEFVTDAAISAHRLKKWPIGTLLVAMYGEGKTRGQVSELTIEATINQACAAVVVDDSLASLKYVKLALQAKYLQMRELAEGGNQPNLNLSKIKSLPVPLPRLPEQQEIVRRVESLFSKADELEAQYRDAMELIETLPEIILSKAFRGELLPQDPNDEPASVLLKRIIESLDKKEPIAIQRNSFGLDARNMMNYKEMIA